MSIITKKRLIAAGIFTALIAGNMAMAADVPAGPDGGPQVGLVAEGNLAPLVLLERHAQGARVVH